jgi:isoquinoline 1-oxidoreductase subunit alpha
LDVTINGQKTTLQADPSKPLLWVLREDLNLTGTKFGCGVMACGACTVHVDGVAQRSCLLPVAAVAGKNITTIEGLSPNRSHALQQAWIKHQVPQCGYCQSGFLMAASALLNTNAKPSDEHINAALTNICRCGTYDAMRAAIHDVAGTATAGSPA